MYNYNLKSYYEVENDFIKEKMLSTKEHIKKFQKNREKYAIRYYRVIE